MYRKEWIIKRRDRICTGIPIYICVILCIMINIIIWFIDLLSLSSTLPDLSLTAFWAAARWGTAAMKTAAMIIAAAGGHRGRSRVAIWLRWCDYVVVPGHRGDVLRGVSGGSGGGSSECSRPVAPRARSISCRRRAAAAGHAYPTTVNTTPPLGICGAWASPPSFPRQQWQRGCRGL